MTTPDRFRRVEEIFLAAKRLAPDERAAFVDERSNGDASIIAEVLDLLREDEQSVGALDRPPLGSVDLPSISDFESPIPDSVGPFRVISLLGEGGMGAVYEAEQRDPRRRVAVKVIRPGLRTKSLLQRFRRETQALAQLSHPGIAQLYEVGQTTSDGVETPYFAMELVRGEPLLQYAERRSLDARDRLRLLESIADALEHAHQRGVVHRDLKPNNILVDDKGQTKILDFGVSRVTLDAADETEHTIAPTQSGVLLGTLSYMSPEQVGADPRAVDARSDVYSLGVIGYELLTGQLPYDVSRANLPESARTIRETEPTSLSSFSRALRGDVETIILKALAKEPSRRYQSAREFAEDIQRHLSDEPIRARPASAAYQLSRFAKRNKPIVAGVAASFAVLLISLAVISALLVRTVRAERDAVLERDEAARQAAIAQEINDFLVVDLIAAASPENTQDRDVSLVDLLEAASKSVDERTFEYPAVEAEIRHTIALTYFELGRAEEALPHAERAVELSNVAYGPDHEATQEFTNTVAHIHRYAGRLDEAAPYYERVLEIRRNRPDTEPAMLVVAMTNLAGLYRSMGRTDDAFSLLEEALELAEESLEPTSPQRLSAQSTLAGAYRESGRYDDAVELYEKVLEITERSFPSDHPRVFRELNSLAIVYTRLSRFEEAEALYKRSLDGQRALFGPDHLQTLITQSNYASMLNDARRYVEAKPLIVDCVNRYNATLGEGHPAALAAAFNLAKVHDSLEEHDDAGKVMKGVVARSRELYGDQHPRVLIAINQLIRIQLRGDATAGLAEASDELINSARAILPADHPYLAIYLMTHADVLARFERREDAISALLEADSILAQVQSGAYDRERASIRNSIKRLEAPIAPSGIAG